MLRIQKVDKGSCHGSVYGAVQDADVADIRDDGAAACDGGSCIPERFDGMGQDEDGIWQALGKRDVGGLVS